MDKLAIFVEGQTEQKFTEKLVLAVMGERVHIDTVQAYGGGKSRRQWVEVEAHPSRT